MPDNVAITAGLGTNISTDEIGGVHFQRVKVTTGVNGTASDVSTDNPMPVSIQGSIPVTVASALEITNDAGNPIPVSGTVQVGNFPTTQAVSGTITDGSSATGEPMLLVGGITAGGLAQVFETNASGHLNISDGGGSITVDAASLPLPTGAATETTLSAIESYFKPEDSTHINGDKGLAVFGIRSDSDIPTANDGDYTILKLDEEGRLKVSAKPASYPDITGDITAIQATIGTPVAGGTVSGDVSRASNIMAFCTGTFSGINCTFEGSIEATGDANWFGIQAVRSNANTIETATGALSAQPAYGWELSVNALKRVRVRATARVSGTQSWRFVQGTYATEPIPAAQVSATQPISGSVGINAGITRMGFTAASGVWYDDSATALASNATFTGTTRDLTVTATGGAWGNATTFGKEFRVSAESDQAGTLWLEASRDSTTWRRIKSVGTSAVTGGAQYAEIIHLPSWRWIRVGFTNGATLQTRFTINSISIGA